MKSGCSLWNTLMVCILYCSFNILKSPMFLLQQKHEINSLANWLIQFLVTSSLPNSLLSEWERNKDCKTLSMFFVWMRIKYSWRKWNTFMRLKILSKWFWNYCLRTCFLKLGKNGLSVLNGCNLCVRGVVGLHWKSFSLPFHFTNSAAA